MRDYSARVDCRGIVRSPSDLTVVIENWGPNRCFEISVSFEDISSSTSMEIKRMGRKQAEFIFPPSNLDGPAETLATISILPCDGEFTELSAKFTYLPDGWFDKLDPDLMTSIGGYIKGLCMNVSEGDDVMRDLSEAYKALEGLNPRPEDTERFFYVSTPEQMMDFGDCSDIEATVALTTFMISHGHECCIARLGNNSYVGIMDEAVFPHIPLMDSINNGRVAFVHPYDSPNGVPFSTSLDSASARMQKSRLTSSMCISIIPRDEILIKPKNNRSFRFCIFCMEQVGISETNPMGGRSRIHTHPASHTSYTSTRHLSS